MTLEAIAKLVGGTVNGDPARVIDGVGSLESAEAGHITYLTKKAFLPRLQESKASAVLVDQAQAIDKDQVVTANPSVAFAKLLNHFHPLPRPQAGIDERAHIGADVVIGENVSIAPFAYIGDHSRIEDGAVVMSSVHIGERCRVGANSCLHPNVTLYPDSEIGQNVILHAGVVVGADGFGYTLDETGRHYKINQIGRVVIEDDVEVGANSCIDRAGIGVTRIGKGTKIDNLVQVAHNCEVGEHSILAGQVGLAGSCTLGKYVVLAGQSGVSDHVKLGDQVTVAAKSGVFRDIEDGQVWAGSPALPASSWRRYVVQWTRLTDMARKLKEMEARLNGIENENSRQ
ncbi:MAG: UDP-3-O-(3-hydroxymyristoyl)glucosamine N-acyltransferase [Candidatus Nitrohelix vancouverensis]|uniref:UDP-3-O-acylglucosamine N-acyltransferase n=1 Tax=Candidatus Nitrohelix vancouverensis TaxID=2705534 RepID=A0A7T0C5J0_9BACT|nr:MAG: UDP-3-O-(3-hydroxymyristoyl)glucosamine N-acyltransferase [Candidatus Nitrohelix vancouverensis]